MVIEDIGQGSTFEKAGLEPGDVVLAWKRLPSPPANPEGADGQLDSVFDWLWLEVEQAPRGPMQLVVERDGKQLVLAVNVGLWGAKVRPNMSPAVLESYLVGKELIEKGNCESGIASWQEIVDGMYGQGDENLWSWLLLRVGDMWTEERAWEKAQTAYRSALEMDREPVAQVAVWDASGKSYERQNIFSEAEASYQSALEIRRAAWGESLEAAFGLNNLGRVALKRGDIELAANRQEQALAIQKSLASRSLPMASSLRAIGEVAWRRGDLNRAAGLFQQALEIRERFASGSLDMATSLSDLGNVLWQRGDLEQAAKNYQQALEITKELAPGSLDMARTLNNLGGVAWSRGNLEQAADYTQRALTIQEGLAPGSLQVALSLSNLGLVARNRGYSEEAITFLERALAIQEKLAPESLDVASTLNNLGTVASNRGELKRATGYFQRAAEIRVRLAPRSLDIAGSLVYLGNTARSRGDLEKAAAYHQQALEIRETLAPGSSAVVNSLYFLGSVSREQGDLKRAAKFFSCSMTALEEQLGKLGGSHELHGRFSADYSSLYRDAVEVDLSLVELEEAFQILERSRARAFLAMLTERELDFSVDTSKELDQARRSFAKLYDQTLQQMSGLNSVRDQDKIAALNKKLRDLRWEHEASMEAIRRASPKLAALQDPQPLDLAGAREALDPGTVLLSYSVGEKRSDLFVLTRDSGLEVYPISTGMSELDGDVERLRELLEDPTFSADDEQARLSRQLYETLIAPAQQTIGASQRILIAADGPLHLMPFGALSRALDDGRQQYLAAWKPLHSVLSATVYAELKKSRPASTSEAGDSFQLAAFGDPLYVRGVSEASEQIADLQLRSITEQDYFDWGPLPSTRREVEEIARLFPAQAARSFLGADATEERAKTLGKTRIVHFAVHAFANSQSPLDSGLVLTLPEHFSEDRDNGLLQVWEIFESLRIDADLVVLSACETGLGELRGGEGLIGLTRAFQYAGARSVLATLWSIGDESSAELMIRFYRHLQAGESKDEALRSAQLEFIHGPIQVRDQQGMLVERDYSDPYHWAAFQLIGDWQ